jgi:hypothetical protein
MRPKPGVERNQELGPETLCGHPHGGLVAGDIGREPGVECQRIEILQVGGLVGFPV